MDRLTSKLSNTYSTGGGGFEFERKVQAIFLLGLIIKGFAPVLKRSIEKVCFQSKILGWNTDDLIVFTENEESKMLCQMKCEVSVTENDTVFQQVINAAWEDFNNTNFKKDKDKIALITGFIAKNSIDALRNINEKALTSLSAKSFLNKVMQPNYSNDIFRDKLDTIRKCLQKANSDVAVSDDELWRFCKCFVLLVFDVDYINGVNECLVKSLIKCKSSVDASFVWGKLQESASSYNRCGAEITLDNLDEDILRFFGLDWQTQQYDLQIKEFVPNDFWAKLAVLGSWDENNSSDMTVIEELFGIPYGQFEKCVQNYLADGNSFISLTNGIWKIKQRRLLFELCDKFYFDKIIEKAFEITGRILKQKDKRFSDDGKINILYTSRGNFDNSDSIRKYLVQGLCILSNSCNLKNCSKDKVLYVKDEFVAKLFKDCNWVNLISLNELLYTISEISPKIYLKELEKFITRNSHEIEKLFPTKQSSLYNNNYICYLLWSIEVLAWHEDYLVDSIRCLGELSSLSYEETNYSNTPINSILSILMPWYPQTLAPVQKQLNAINSLVRENPRVGWKILKGLLPSSSTSVTSGTLKPKYLKIEIPQEIKVESEQTHKVYTHCFSLALKIASHDAQKISELVSNLSYVGTNAITAFLKAVQEYSDIWTDSQKLNVWLALNDYKFGIICENENEEPETELFSYLNDTVAKLTPKDCFYKNRRIFLSNINEFTVSEDDDSWKKLVESKADAVKEVYEKYGADGVYNFGTEINKEYEVFPALGRLVNVEELNHIFAKYVGNEYNSVFVYYTIDGFVSLNGVCTLQNIGLENYSNEFIADILTHMNFSADLLGVVHDLLADNENLYWSKAKMPVCYYSGCDFDFKFVVNKLIENNRLAVIVNMLGKSREVPPIEEDVIYWLLENTVTIEQDEKLDAFAVQRLIKWLQDSDHRNLDRLSSIEFLYLPWLDEYSRIQPRALKTKLAQSPEFFCEIIEKTFKKHSGGHDENKQKDEGLVQRLFQIVFRFDVVPGTDWNGNFDSTKFKTWISYALKWSKENDREAVTKQTIGNGLSYAKVGEDGIPNEHIIEVLNEKENEEIREGYAVGIFNQRGVHWVDPEGKPEKELAAKYQALAEKVEKMGYSRFSGSLREIAQSYLNEAERNILSEKLRTESEE